MREGIYRKVEVAGFGEFELELVVMMMIMKIEKILYRDVEEHVVLGQ